MSDRRFILDHLYDPQQEILEGPERKPMETAFDKSLNRFIREFGYGDAVMHLADKGYTLRQIKERIGARLPEEYLCEKMIKSYVEHGRALLEEPGSFHREKTTMVKDLGEFGRVSFRQVKEIIEEPRIEFAPYQWGETDREAEGLTGNLRRLKERWALAGAGIYASFLITKSRLSLWETSLSERQTDFLRCFCYLNKEIYLLVDERVLEILKIMLEKHIYQGTIYFLREEEKWIID